MFSACKLTATLTFGGVRCQRGHQITVSILSVMGSRDEIAMVSAWGLVLPETMSQ